MKNSYEFDDGTTIYIDEIPNERGCYVWINPSVGIAYSVWRETIADAQNVAEDMMREYTIKYSGALI